MRSSRLVCCLIGIVIHLWNSPGLSASQAPSRVNVAMDGTATQSSTYTCSDEKKCDCYGKCSWDGNASRAIDGDSDSDSSCTLTKKDSGPWWRLQLPGVFKVAEIEVTNRRIDGELLIGTEIFIGNSENSDNNNSRCATINSSNLIQTFQCRGMEGRFIHFYKPCVKGKVQFCEVKVYGELVPPPVSTSTLVMGRSVTLVVGKRLCWSDALLYCRDFHSDLLSIRGPEEQEMIQQLVAGAPVPPTSHLWVGLRSSNSRSSWFWMTGDSMSFTQWEPGPLTSLHPCGGIVSMEQSTWSPSHCDEHLDFICLTDPAEGKNQVHFYSSTRSPIMCDKSSGSH